MKPVSFLAFDLGAESGRAMLMTIENSRLALSELHRYPTGMTETNGRFRWDLPRLVREARAGLKACADSGSGRPESLAFDTWGVDFGLLDARGELIELPLAYRDSHTEGAMESFFSIVPADRVYELTGIQFMRFNTLFQLHAMKKAGSAALEKARTLLFIPDLHNHAFTGQCASEFTFATTSQLYNPRTGGWEAELFRALGVPVGLMQKIVQPGTTLGKLTASAAEGTNLAGMPVVAAASHDTGSAIAAVPATGDDWAYISSGTWSLMGIESPAPIITRESRAINFTNEGGVGPSFRVMKNVMGLWLVQQCRRAWLVEKEWGYAELAAMAAAAPAFSAFIDPDSDEFFNPPDMPAAVRDFCRRTGQPVPEDKGAVLRCVMESLALKYRMVLGELRRVSPHRINRIHVVGGGSKNTLLNRMTAGAAGIPVIAGPGEATALGNCVVQAVTAGAIRSLAEARAAIAASFPPERFEPEDVTAWDKAAARFAEIAKRSR